MKSRTIKDALVEKNKSPLGRIIVLTGARQTGKTTLARACFPTYTYLSIEDPVMRGNYRLLTAAQWEKSYPKAILDEVQKEPSLIESIKSVFDQYPAPRYILLGSSQLLLLQKIKESLAGRCHIQEVYPLTLPELLTQGWEQTVKQSFFQRYLANGSFQVTHPSFAMLPDYSEKCEKFEYYLRYGGYPALVTDGITNKDRNDWLSNYVRTYLERDIRDLADFKSLEPFIKVQKMTAHLSAQLINYSSLAREANVSIKTAQRFLQYLEISYQTILLPAWHKNALKRMVKAPKLHYLDPGVQRAILQKKGDVTGHEFESAIVAELYKQAKNYLMPVTFYHLRTIDGREVDLLIETEYGYIAIEIKQSQNINHTDARHLKNLQDILDKPLLQSFILSNDNRVNDIADNIISMPAAMFLT
jgi:predicted AAA+ superfamily ATPase